MSEHLSECELLEPCSADIPEHGFYSRQQTYCIHCERACICERLSACEIRVIGAAVQRIEALWSLDPSWDGTNWNNALTSALAAIKGDQQ